MTLIRIDFCCNDPDNGNFDGRAHAIQLPDNLAEFEPRDWQRPPRFADDGEKIRLAGKSWPYVNSKEWFGNWCWNAYWLQVQTAVDFLIWLHGRRLYSLTCGESRLYNMWKLDPPLDKWQDDRAFIARILEKSMLAEDGQ